MNVTEGMMENVFTAGDTLKEVIAVNVHGLVTADAGEGCGIERDA